MLKAILLRTEQEKRSVIEKASIIVEKTYSTMNGMLVEIGTRKVILGSAKLELRNMFTATERKEILTRKRQRAWLNCFVVFYGRQNL